LPVAGDWRSAPEPVMPLALVLIVDDRPYRSLSSFLLLPSACSCGLTLDGVIVGVGGGAGVGGGGGAIGVGGGFGELKKHIRISFLF